MQEEGNKTEVCLGKPTAIMKKSEMDVDYIGNDEKVTDGKLKCFNVPESPFSP